MPERDARDEKIERLEAVIVELRRELAAARAEIAELKARLGQDSSNSSRPPSTDQRSLTRKLERPGSGRKRGGQPGHQKHERRLLPVGQVDRVVVIKPEACRRCGDPLGGDDPAPYRHQVTEIPRVVAAVSEYQLHALKCPRCKITTRAALPKGVPASVFGPRLQAMVAVCHGAYRMSKRMVEEVVEDFFGVEISLGSVCELAQRTSAALAEPVAAVAAQLQAEQVVHADETGWRESGKKAWLWVGTTTSLALFLIRRSRGAKVAKELLGEFFGGLLCSDRWVGYGWVKVWRRQLCWAHLYRHFVGFESYGKKAMGVGKALQAEAEEMYRLWHQARDGTLARSAFQREMQPIQAEILRLLEAGTLCRARKVAGCCREILALKDALFTFVREEGVEPTNNNAERILRSAVLWRKSSFGTDSESGSRFVERILTTVATLRLQKRNILDFVTCACEAMLHHQPAPSLLSLPTNCRSASRNTTALAA